jgi:hypothetical protein
VVAWWRVTDVDLQKIRGVCAVGVELGQPAGIEWSRGCHRKSLDHEISPGNPYVTQETIQPRHFSVRLSAETQWFKLNALV